jgi:hypothetical protein
MVKFVVLVTGPLVVGLIAVIWLLTRGRPKVATFEALRAQDPAAARAWIDTTFPHAPGAKLKGAHERIAALSLIGDFATIEREIGLVEGTSGHHLVARMVGWFALTVRGPDPRRAAEQLHALYVAAKAQKMPGPRALDAYATFLGGIGPGFGGDDSIWLDRLSGFQAFFMHLCEDARRQGNAKKKLAA